MDTSQLMSYVSSYIFPNAQRAVVDHMVLGVSLGGHAAWHCILHDPRISTAIIVVGCPDYAALMSDRARLSKLKTWTQSHPPGSQFIGSKDFPPGLVEAVESFDPAGMFLGPLATRSVQKFSESPSEQEQKRLIPLMSKTLQGKRILTMAGGADKLVPYKCGQPFIAWFKRAISKDGWFADGAVTLKDLVFEGVGHEMSPGMAKEANQFITETLSIALSKSAKTSKI